MTCLYPNNSRGWAYRKGCRCGECRAHKVTTQRAQAPRFSCRCGRPMWLKDGRCNACRRSPGELIDRVMARIEISTKECWLWPGERNRWGYGRVSRDGRAVVVHRVTYEHFVGEVPAGLELDHLCRVPACCNPDHLEPVTHQENLRRARAAKQAQMYREAVA